MPISHPSTFSIVAHDPDAQALGIAVASKFLAVGAVVPFARAGIGAIATQSYANTTFGPAGLELLSQGYSAQDALNGLIAADEGRDQRQVGVVDVTGEAATYTGSACYAWAGGRTGNGYAAQGNILTGPEVVDALAETFERTQGELADRLLAALHTGQEAGGDSRGRQSAALLVVRPHGGYAGFDDRAVDLRVDDHPDPVAELQRIYRIHTLYFTETRAEDVLPIDEEVSRRIRRVLQAAGISGVDVTGPYDETTRDALRALSGRENLEGRWREGPEIDQVALEYLEAKYPEKESGTR